VKWLRFRWTTNPEAGFVRAAKNEPNAASLEAERPEQLKYAKLPIMHLSVSCVSSHARAGANKSVLLKECNRFANLVDFVPLRNY
jgi:hypothetical protein